MDLPGREPTGSFRDGHAGPTGASGTVMRCPTATPAADIDPEEAVAWWRPGPSSSTCARTTSGTPATLPRPSTWPWGWWPTRLDELPTDRTVVCVCRVGGGPPPWPSALAAAGYDVRNLAGGMLAWEPAGLPVVTGDGSAGRII